MEALVTGGAGFIGSHLVDALVARRHAVVALDDLSTGRLEHLEGALAASARFEQADVTDAEAIERVFAASRPSVVFHLAGQVDVRRSVENPQRDEEVNVGGTIKLLEAAVRHGVRRFLLASTGGALYGEASEVPTREDAPIRPMSPYGQGKHAAEGYCHLFERLHGLSTVCLRLANVYGPRQGASGEGGVIAIFTGASARGKQPVVFGSGKQTRDFIHVDDVVAAFLAAAEAPAGGSINIGTGVETSVLDLLGLVGLDADAASFRPARPGEITRSALDSSLAQAALDWRPHVIVSDGVTRLLATISSPQAPGGQPR